MFLIYFLFNVFNKLKIYLISKWEIIGRNDIIFVKKKIFIPKYCI